MQIRRILAATTAVALLGTLAACSSSSDAEGGSSTDAGGKGAVAMSFAGMDITIWNDELKFMRPIVEDAGYEFLTDDPQWQVQKQVNDWDSWITRGDVKAIMGFPVQTDAIVPVTQRAQEAGIPVLAYAAPWEGVTAGVLVDGYADGVTVGEAAGEWINENYADAAEVPVGIVADMTSDFGKQKADGLKDGLEQTAKNVKVYNLPGVSRDEGYAAATAQLTAHPDTKVWLGTSNDNMTGAYQALLDSGVAKDDPGYAVGSPDATNETLDIIGIPDSIWRIGFIVSAKELGEANANMLVAAANGDDVKDVTISAQRVTPENIDGFYVK
ncbi:sugar ABC transporter substrate-binding protein [Herbiconiux sp. KACC 21604]|uniref:sugar ABC transporter substrate-binding protein n=1 Tax=unclassified Herbiconiux TaxID=2618217 RepID=UPI00149116E4|nr:sugar ABC transporter substrate-binding protein [Herbiconiux sp. SALV-R1]QJU53462.1 sugar ABC transporter substrate-binding protein [Herbiconiux sp. SALV-R1]WPO88434.1 sugar ABC transporter substrate-binding protein [Herbiconiux sp. KACC 21604]